MEVENNTTSGVESNPNPLNVILTSGGTKVYIDGVRCITNSSKGTTGALIGEDLLEAGHHVHYLYAEGAKVPFGEGFVFDKALAFGSDFEIRSELARIKEHVYHYRDVARHLEEEMARDFHAYRERLLELVNEPKSDITVLCMAASDYGPDFTEGKISSSEGDMNLALHELPKIITEVKRERGDIFLVGFKFLMNKSPDELIEVAYRSMLRDKQDIAVANVAVDAMEYDQLKTYILTVEKGIIPVDRDDLSRVLVDTIESRFSRNHYRTAHTKVERLPLPEDDVDRFLGQGRRLSQLALFAPYLDGSHEEFGFLAQRTNQGTLITGRGSSKSKGNVDEIALVTAVDEANCGLEVTSTGKKAALNANLAHLILEHRPEVNVIVHSHIDHVDAVRSVRQTAPSTREDWDAVKPFVLDGESIIHQPYHGLLILLEDLAELQGVLERNRIYEAHPEHYDMAYGRFQSSTTFIDRVCQDISTSDRVLDMAAGTGEVSRALLERGIADVVLRDRSTAMLAVAQSKLPDLDSQRFQTGAMEAVTDVAAFDRILVRQAINYVAPDDLIEVFSRFHRALRAGGTLHFNTFKADTTQIPLLRSVRNEDDEYVVRTREGNLIEGDRIFHGQHSEIFTKHQPGYQQVYDLNSFYIHADDAFRSAGAQAGFSNVWVDSHGHSLAYRLEV